MKHCWVCPHDKATNPKLSGSHTHTYLWNLEILMHQATWLDLVHFDFMSSSQFQSCHLSSQKMGLSAQIFPSILGFKAVFSLQVISSSFGPRSTQMVRKCQHPKDIRPRLFGSCEPTNLSYKGDHSLAEEATHAHIHIRTYSITNNVHVPTLYGLRDNAQKTKTDVGKAATWAFQEMLIFNSRLASRKPTL